MRAIVVSFLLVGAGGALGAMTRLGMNLLLAHRILIVPLGTLASNYLGCFIMGIVLQLLLTAEWFNQSSIVAEQNRLLFAVGFCGSLTTLSSMVVEMNTLMQRSEILGAFTYLFLSLAGGFACFYAGAMLVRP
jgi:CrcB protein